MNECEPNVGRTFVELKVHPELLFTHPTLPTKNCTNQYQKKTCVCRFQGDAEYIGRFAMQWNGLLTQDFRLTA